MSAPEVIAPAAGEPRIIRFGVFEVDWRSRELRKGDIPVKLADQSFRILELLLGRPGDVVSREEMVKELWPGNTFVDFDRSLNAAVKKLRRALGDSPRNPKFIETLPKRGYRFIAADEIVYSGNGAEGVLYPGRLTDQAGAPLGESQSTSGVALTEAGIQPGWRRRPLVSVSLGSLALLATLVLWLGLRANNTIPFVTAREPRQARPVTDLPNVAAGPVLSPDGEQVAFVWTGEEIPRDPANWDIYVKRLSDGRVTRLTTDPGGDFNPAWSPDGSSIVFQRNWPAASPGVYVVSLSDGSKRRIGGGRQPSWTPDSKGVVTGGEGIHVVPLETFEREELLPNPPEGVYQYPVISPDGEWLAYSLCPQPSACDVRVSPLTGGEARRLTFEPGRITGLAWTPDSREVVYSLEGRLYRVAGAGGVEARTVEFAGAGLGAGRSVLPSITGPLEGGSYRLAFEHRMRDIDVWITDITGYGRVGSGEYRKKVIDSPAEDIAPEFSPDGSRIAFVSDREGGERALWVCNRDGSDPRRITPEMFRVGNLASPSWSRDGSRIAFRAATDEDPAYHIYTVASDGGAPRRVTNGDDVAAPAWSRDGLWIYHQSNQSGRKEIWKTPWNGSGPAVPVSGMLSWSFTESPDGRHVYFCGVEKAGTPYGALWRVSAEGGTPERVAFPFSFNRIIASSRGLYYLDRTNEEINETIATMKLLDPATGTSTEVGHVKDPMGPRHFSISPDGRFMLTNNVDRIRSELMVIEDFR